MIKESGTEKQEPAWKKMSIMAGSGESISPEKERKKRREQGEEVDEEAEEVAAAAIRLGAQVEEEDVLLADQHLGLVIDYNDAAIETHAKRAKMSQIITTSNNTVRTAAPTFPHMPILIGNHVYPTHLAHI